MVPNTHSFRRAFSLLELVIVVVILGIIGAIAIPRMSRGSEGASDSALVANLAVLRNAIELYQAEHEGLLPTAADIEAQLTTYTSAAGADNATKDTTYIYGPYIRTIPPLPVGTNKGSNGIAAADAAGVGWIYDATTGAITANLPNTELDARGVPYTDY
ncbi:MAG: prepilin-type N-terminal cleavage/methylation domain-containing protein [Phycisphaerales bacterium]|jgi:prepilin-type N-terminal cleavage/methylation domain-containing protein|nr:prepilin-type N-terminal cleavage/methylation domain-containing protein [Phycisphaerales bacterium]